MRQTIHTRKTLTRLLALVAAIALSACSSIPQALVDAIPVDRLLPGAATAAPIRQLKQVTAPPMGVTTAELVRQRSTIRVGVRFDAPPLSSVNESGELEGMDIDIAREMARRWLGSGKLIEFVQVTNASAPEKIRLRQIDLALGGLVHTRDAEDGADFGLQYFEDGEAILTRANAFKDLKSLSRQTLEYVDFPTLDAVRTAQIIANITTTLLSNTSYERAVQDLKAGKAVGVAGNLRRLRLEVLKDPQFQILQVIQRNSVAIMIPENDSAWSKLVDATLANLMRDGTFSSIYAKWWQTPPTLPRLDPAIEDTNIATLSARRTISDSLTSLRLARTARIGFIAGNDGLVAVDAKNQPVGFEIDLSRELSKRWFGADAAVQFVPVPAAQLSAMLLGDKINLAVGAIDQGRLAGTGLTLSEPTFLPVNGITRTVSIRSPIGFALPENSSELRDLVNMTVQDTIKDGTYAKLYRKWFGANAPLPDLPIWKGDYNPITKLVK